LGIIAYSANLRKALCGVLKADYQIHIIITIRTRFVGRKRKRTDVKERNEKM